MSDRCRHWRRAAGIAALITVAAALSACSGGGGVDDLPPEPSAPASPASTAPAPETPPEPVPEPTPDSPGPYGSTPIAVPGAWEAENFDRGGEGVAYHDTTVSNLSGEYRAAEDVDIIVSTTGFAVSHFETGEWLAYTIEVAETREYDISLLVVSPFAASAFHLEIDGGVVTDSVSVPNAGNWHAFEWVEQRGVTLPAGRHIMRVVADEQYFDIDALRVTLPAAQPPPPPNPANVLFLCTFVTGPTDCGFQEHAKVAGRATLVSNARDGGTGVRLHTEPGDSDVTGSGQMERNDLWLTQAATDGYEGREQWWAHSLYLPDDFVIPTWHNYVFFDFHNTALGDWQANFHVLNRNGILTFQGYGGVTESNQPVNPFSAPIGPIQKNVWYDFVYHVKWSSGSDGYFDAWVNGVKKLSHRGPTLYAGQGVYLKLANYHVPVCDPYPACIGTHAGSSVIHDRIVRGSAPLAVSLGPLEGVLDLVDGVLTPLLP
ncbi:MAG TPA: heparin lyase I family protein [Gammaproteobacteria bacterium]|nr:heparin lyase I family protein [Gammaproteobacteria bacterium]